MLGEQITAGQLTNKECITMPIHDMMTTMRFVLGITTRYIDCHPTASMTNNPPSGCHLRKPWVLSCKQQIVVVSKVHNVNNTIILRQSIVVFSLVATTHPQS